MVTKIAGIHQPNYIPWPGYFHKIVRSDVFVILDNVDFQQGNSKSITSRTKIKGANGEILLTVPVKHLEDKQLNRILPDTSLPWTKKHLKSIALNYARAPHFKTWFPVFEKILAQSYPSLAHLNTAIIREVCAALELKTPLVVASDLAIEETGRNERIVAICKAVGADTYLCGKGGRKYMEEAVFDSGGIKVKYTDFQPQAYPQLFEPFVPGLSILDALMNAGKEGTFQLIQ
jgi:hypothetical protein